MNTPSTRPPTVVIRPRALAPGARVALVAPAGPLSGDRIERAAARCRTLGLEPLVYPAASHRVGFLAGTDDDRLGDLQAAFDDPSVDGIWALRGGYGTLRILDRLDLERQRRAPIPFIGFSDLTTIHVRHAQMGVVSFHGPNAGGPFPDDVEAWFRRLLFEADPPGRLPRGPEEAEPRTVATGRAEGRLFGGNLALLASLCGSAEARPAQGRILFFEDVGEAAYRVDRMLTQIGRAGMCEGVTGLAIGRFTGCPDGEEDLVRDVLDAFAQRLGVPAVADLSFGHVDYNYALPVGGRALLDADAGTLTLLEPAVAG